MNISIRYDYSNAAEKFFSKHEEVRSSFKSDIKRILTNDHPELVDYKNLKGKFKGYSRIAIDDYRVVYRLLNDRVIVVDVILAGSRGDIYKKLQRKF